MKKIIIVGAGGFGRELLWWVEDVNKAHFTWTIAGFIDDDPHALDGYGCNYKIIGTIKDWQPREDEEFALAIGSPSLKKKIVGVLKKKGAHFANVIHPTAMLNESASVGEGLVMFPYSKVSCNSSVGDFVTILATPIGHDTVIGDYSVISGGCNVVRNVRIGNEVFMAAGVCVAQDVIIGDRAYIGLGSVVLKDVPPGATVFGNPARALPTIK